MNEQTAKLFRIARAHGFDCVNWGVYGIAVYVPYTSSSGDGTEIYLVRTVAELRSVLGY